MKKIMLVLFLMTLSLFFAASSYAFKEGGQNCVKCHTLSEKDMNPILDKIRMPGSKILSVQMSSVKGLWEVAVENRGRRFLIYVDFAKKYISPGPFIDYASGRDMTRERMEALNKDKKIDTRTLSLDNAFVIGKADARIKVIVFTDPGCGYCAKLHPEMKKLVAKRPDIAFFLKVFALVSPDPQVAKSIICSKSQAALEDAYDKKPVPKQECASTELEQNMRFAEENGIDSVPALILPDGTLQTGFAPAQELEKWIDGAAASTKKKEGAARTGK